MKLTLPMALGLLFVALKLCGVIAWGWLWVLSPFWIGIPVFFVALAVLLLLSFGSRFK